MVSEIEDPTYYIRSKRQDNTLEGLLSYRNNKVDDSECPIEFVFEVST